MNTDLLVIALIAGAATWGFRVLPLLVLRGEPRPEGLLARFLGATGPAAIATLFVASVMPMLHPDSGETGPLIAGTIATLLAFLPRRSVVVATLAGALAYGAVFALIP